MILRILEWIGEMASGFIMGLCTSATERPPDVIDGAPAADGAVDRSRRDNSVLRSANLSWHLLNASVVALVLTCGVGDSSAQEDRSPGLRAYWSYSQSDCVKLGHVDWARYHGTSIEEQVNWEQTSGPLLTDGPTDYFALRLVGKLEVPSGGNWTFTMWSDEAARLWIDGELVINDGLLHGYRPVWHTIDLTAGEHDIEIRYLERRYSAGLVLRWEGPGVSEEVIPASALSHPPEEPVFDSGGTGLWAYWYEGMSHATDLGQVEWSEHDRVEVVERVSFDLTRGEFELGGPTDYFAARFVGQLDVPEEGSWTFELGSDEAASVLIDGQYVIADPAVHGYRWKSGAIELTEGSHHIEVRYLERRYSAGLKLAWRGPSDSHVSIVPSSAFSPGSGATSPASGGLVAYWSDGVSHATSVGQVNWEDYDRLGTEPNISWRLTQGAFVDGGASDYFALRLAGKLNIPRSGAWTFGLGSDESARLMINGVVVVNDDTPHGFRWKNGVLTLPAGQHDIEVLYLERRYSAGLVLTWQGPGDAVSEVIPAAAFEAEAPPAGASGEGLRAYWAEGQSHATKVGQVDWTQYDEMSVVPSIAWRLTRGAFREGGATDYFGVRLVGRVAINQTGSWRFSLGSDESAQLYIDGELVINDDTPHGYRWRSVELDLSAGTHDFEVRYLERRYSAGLTTTWRSPSGYEQVIPATAFSHSATEIPFDDGGGGLRAYWSEGVSHAREVGQVDWEQHDAVTTVDNVGWRLTRGGFRDGGATDYFAVRLVGRIDIPEDGSWRLSVGADESVALFVDGEPVVADTTPHGFRWASGSLSLTAGLHDIEIWYLERRYSAGLFLTWQGPGVPAEIVVPATALSLRETEEPYEPGGGLRAYWSSGVTHALNVGQIDWAEHDSSSVIEKVSWNITNGAFRVNGATDYFALRAVGLVNIPESGAWRFNLGSDESAQLYIDGELIVSDHVGHGYRWTGGSVTLSEGLHSFEVRYLERRYSAGLGVTWQGPNMPFATIIPASAFSQHDEPIVVDAGEPGLTATWAEGVWTDAESIEFSSNSTTTMEHRVSWRLSSGAMYPDGPSDYFGLRLVGRLVVPRGGSWTFNLGSDESAVLTIDGSTVVWDGSMHGFRWVGGGIYLDEGEHDLELKFVERRYNAGLFLTWKGPGDVCESVIPADAFIAPNDRQIRVVRWSEVGTAED